MSVLFVIFLVDGVLFTKKNFLCAALSQRRFGTENGLFNMDIASKLVINMNAMCF